jgi:hypothetical protein
LLACWGIEIEIKIKRGVGGLVLGYLECRWRWR